MTFPHDQNLESLIADIDRVLLTDSNQSDADWYQVAEEQKLVLENLRRYLVSLDSKLVTPTAPPEELSSIEQEMTAAIGQNPAPYRAIAEAIVEQMNSVGVNPVQTWRDELAALRQERELLQQEVTQLRQERQQQLAEFLQVLTTRLQASLRQQMVQTWSNLEAEFLQSQPPDLVDPEQTPLILKQLQQVEQLRRLQQETDGLLLNLDVTFRAVLETLQRDLQSYEQSLSEGLANLYDLGKKGELLNVSLLSSSPVITPEVNKLSREQISSSDRESLASARKRLSPQVYPFAGIEIRADSALGNEEQFLEISSDGDREEDNEFSRSDEKKSSNLSGDLAIEAIFQLDLPPEQINPDLASIADRLGSPDNEQTGTSESLFVRITEAVDESFADWRSPSHSSRLETPGGEAILFAGLPDPASGSGLTPLVDFTSAPTPRTAQEFLFGEDADDVSTLPNDTNPITVAMIEDSDAVETINALTELIELPTQNSSDVAPVNFEFIPDPNEDDYLPASPEENLLLTNKQESDREDLENVLDENKLQQLSEDLQRFESESQSLDYSFNNESSLFEENSAVDSFALPEELLAEEDLENFPLDRLSEEVDTEQNQELNKSSENFMFAQEFTIVSPWDEESTQEVTNLPGEENTESVFEEQFDNSDRPREQTTSHLEENIAVIQEETALANEEIAPELEANNAETVVSEEETALANEEIAPELEANNAETVASEEETALANEEIAPELEANSAETVASEEETALANEEIAPELEANSAETVASEEETALANEEIAPELEANSAETVASEEETAIANEEIAPELEANSDASENSNRLQT
ncbi:hypothetical protein [Oscillatoria salina]|uniref:hypothetical protein n=1 Tax=Oscillatoria salina TaxID=331517 RepID=UPI001CCE592C|nr:hypothetical protein [Oscillatoria salina]MBZ8181317.1 hypothetical protein [Oscillatoria salina IIICB1]